MSVYLRRGPPEQRVAIAHAAHPEALPFARLDDCTGDLLGEFRGLRPLQGRLVNSQRNDAVEARPQEEREPLRIF
jgi:hypothetical protein